MTGTLPSLALILQTLLNSVRSLPKHSLPPSPSVFDSSCLTRFIAPSNGLSSTLVFAIGLLFHTCASSSMSLATFAQALSISTGVSLVQLVASPWPSRYLFLCVFCLSPNSTCEALCLNFLLVIFSTFQSPATRKLCLLLAASITFWDIAGLAPAPETHFLWKTFLQVTTLLNVLLLKTASISHSCLLSKSFS